MTASAAHSGFGTFLQLESSTGTYLSIAEIFSITPPGIERDMIDCTHEESDEMFREYIGGLLTATDVGLNLNYRPLNETHQDMLANLSELTLADIARDYRVCWPNYGEVTATVSSVAPATNLITTSGNHGFQTGQPILLRTDGTLPNGNYTNGVAYTGNITLPSGKLWFVQVLSATTLLLHPSSASAAGNTTPVDILTEGAGNLTLLAGSESHFRGMFKSCRPSAPQSDRLSADVTLKITGNISFPAA